MDTRNERLNDGGCGGFRLPGGFDDLARSAEGAGVEGGFVPADDDAEQMELFASSSARGAECGVGSAVMAEPKSAGVGEAEFVDASDVCAADAGQVRRMTRERIVGRILELCPTATTEFLEQFDDDDLHDYLRRLNYSRRPRDSKARWVRDTQDPGIEWRDRAA